MKKVIAWLLAIALTAAISIGATLAYLTDTDEDVNVMTLGKVKIDQLEYERVDVESKNGDATVQEFHDNKPLLPTVIKDGLDYSKPGDTFVDWDQIGKDGYTSPIWNPELINNEVDKMVFVKNKGDYDAYVRSVFAFEAGKYTTLDEFQKMVHLNLNETDWDWKWSDVPVAIPNEDGSATTNYFIATATYNKVLAPGALTEISLSQIALDKTATNEDVEAFGDTYQVLVKSQGIQADGFDDPNTALNDGFGAINTENIPWENDAATKGITVRQALHYLDGDTTGTKITSKVTNVVFGLNEKNTGITEVYDGVLVDVEQDVPVYAYYVPNGSNYDVYFLANDDIYLPKTSDELFSGMSVLQTVDSANLNTGRCENMYGMFYNCRALTKINGITDWDTSNVTNMEFMFRKADALPELDLSGWDVSNVTNTYGMFYDCVGLKTLNVTGWDTSNVTRARVMFIRCRGLENFIGSGGLNFSKVTDMSSMCEGWDSLTYLDATNWNCGSATNMGQMFGWALKLKTIEGIENWDVSKNENFTTMFRFSYELEDLDLSTWKPSSGKTFNSMFSDCTSFNPDKDIFDNWDMSSAVKINHMFYNCKSLEEVNLSDWNMPNLITTTHMFADCGSLKTVNFDNWNTPSLVSLDCIFNDCVSLTYLDMSDIDTANVTEFSQMFERCTSLERVDGMENWDTSKSGTFVEMFLDCSSLEELNWSTFDTRAAYNNYYDTNNSYSKAFNPIFTGVNNLTKLIVSDKISYYGNGTVPEADKLVFPDPKPMEGYTAMWRNVETGELYLGKDIPEFTAATYVAYYEYTPKGATIYNAVNFLNGDSNSTKITTKVSNITFGLRKDYEPITSQYTGVLVDAEQDAPAYAYYVPNGTNYDVYILSDTTIYAPTDCSNLCNGMSNLVSFNTANLDFSRTASMYQMFRDCTNLADVTSGNWNTANVTNMGYAFYNCQNLQTLVTANWNTGNVTNLGWTFFQCKNLKTIDTTNWDTSSVTSLLATFNSCEKLETLDVSNWNTSSLTDPGAAFQNCKALKTLDVSNWDVSKVTRTTQMFNGCESLESLPVTNWNFEKLEQTTTMFQNCKALKTLDVSKWNMSTVFRIEGMFNHCETIEFLDVSNWDVSGMSNMGTAFQQCWQLKTLDVSNWDTSSVTTMGWLFYGCKNLEVIDISKWDVSKVTIMSHMFADCNKVKELKVDNWDLSSLQSLDATFNDCDALTTINVSKWNTGNIREFSQSFEGCDNLAEIVGLENWNTSNGRVFDEMFNACKSLKVLDLSSFNTQNVTPGFKNVNGDICKGFSSTFAGMNSVEKIILGPNFRFAGNGQVTEQYQPKFPNPAPINGQATKWYNAANDTYYTAAEIPEPGDVAVTYVAAVPPVTP